MPYDVCMSNITIRIDDDLKEKATELFADLGLGMNQAITLFLKASVREQGIPFMLKRRDPNKDTIQAIKELIDMENDPDKYESFSSVEDLMKDLNDH